MFNSPPRLEGGIGGRADLSMASHPVRSLAAYITLFVDNVTTTVLSFLRAMLRRLRSAAPFGVKGSAKLAVPAHHFQRANHVSFGLVSAPGATIRPGVPRP